MDACWSCRCGRIEMRTGRCGACDEAAAVKSAVCLFVICVPSLSRNGNIDMSIKYALDV